MPEGHTLFRLAREQSELFAGRPVHVTSPQGRFASGAALLDGRVLDEATSYGKHLFARFGGDTVHVHLGLYGSFTTGTGTPPPAKGALRMRWEGPGPDGDGVWTDLRGADRLRAASPTPGGPHDPGPAGPGPAAPPLGPGHGVRPHRPQSKTPIGALLMDQEVLAGVGNVYRAEILFRHRLAPFRLGRDVDAETWARLWADLVKLMRAGVQGGPDRHHRARPTATASAARPGRRTRTTSTAAPGCPAGSAAPRCAPR